MKDACGLMLLDSLKSLVGGDSEKTLGSHAKKKSKKTHVRKTFLAISVASQAFDEVLTKSTRLTSNVTKFVKNSSKN